MTPMSSSAMSPEVFRSACAPILAAREKLTVFLMGGEPCLHLRIGEMIAYLKAFPNVYVDMNTHGMMLPKKAQILIDAGIDAIYVSLDGSTAEINDATRGVGAFARTLAGLEALFAARERSARLVKVAINYTVTNQNVSDLMPMAEVAAKLGVDELCINLPTYVTREEGDAAEFMLQTELGLQFESWRGFLIDSVVSDISGSALQKSIERLKTKKWPFVLFLQPVGYSPVELSSYFSKEWTTTLRQKGCPIQNFRTTVLPNGDVTPCTIYPDLIVGNVLESSLRDIWHGPRYAAFRSVVTRRLLPTCRRCCDLFDETQSDPDAFLTQSRLENAISA
jgi:radical SAM protein with 4Fe4S-binding SPASM domain